MAGLFAVTGDFIGNYDGAPADHGKRAHTPAASAGTDRSSAFSQGDSMGQQGVDRRREEFSDRPSHRMMHPTRIPPSPYPPRVWYGFEDGPRPGSGASSIPRSCSRSTLLRRPATGEMGTGPSDKRATSDTRIPKADGPKFPASDSEESPRVPTHLRCLPRMASAFRLRSDTP